jgi:putative transcriptional regulator
MANSKHSEFFELVHGALADGVEALEAGKTLTTRDVEIPDPPAEMSASDIAAFRKQKLRVSQRVFAGMLNASPNTIHAWEQGRKKPSGIALRLLRLIQSRPEIFTDEIGLRGKNAKSSRSKVG